MKQPANYDSKEIIKFDLLAHDWWNPKGKFQSLHHINPLRLHFIKQHASLKNQMVLDVGCGGGILTESLAKCGAKTTGIDLGETSLNIAKQHALEQHLMIDYHLLSVEILAEQKPEAYDVVVCMELLEHVPDPAKVVSACAQLTKPGGELFFSTIHRNPKAYLFAILGAEYFLNLLPKGTHDYTKFIRPSELVAWSRSAGLSLQQFQGFAYNMFSKEYYLTDNIDVNYLAYCKKE